jgi:hypothetical protein
MKKKTSKNSGAGKAAAMPDCQPFNEGNCDFPPPEVLLNLAKAEEMRARVGNYAETIRVLRDEKNFTFRRIAAWLTENGVPADHNTVYRVYMDRPMTAEEERDLSIKAALDEGEED